VAKILVIADLEGVGFATPRGLELARRLGYDTDVVAFTHAPLKDLKLGGAEEGRIKQRLLDDRREVVQERIDKHAEGGQKVALKVVWEKDIDRWVSRQCAGGKYVGVVKTGNRSETLVHTSTDWQLLRECPAPVLLVSKKKWHRVKPVRVTLDLATTVPTKKKLNSKVLGHARALADALGVELEIITAIEIPTLLQDLDLVDPIAYVKEARAGMQRAISKLSEDHDIPESAFRTKRGPVEKVITSYAAKVRAQIVVMGTVGRTGVKARLLGNTAEKVLRHMRTDVLAIKP
jgi:universal stress protein E